MAGLDVPRGAPAPRRPLRRAVAASVTIALAVFGGAFAATSPAHADGPTTFSNTTAIDIPASGSANQIGPASPYPSNITVSGMAGAVTAVQVVFHGLTHGILSDLDAMVVAPTGANLVVLSDVAEPATFATASNATLTFDDAAAGAVPSGNVPTGTYRPTNGSGVGADAFPAPAPAPSAQTTLAGAFTGINPNGTWQLFIVDDATGDLGSMAGGWSLVITTEVAAAATTTTVTTSASPSTTGSPVTFTATVTTAGSAVTTGTVTFAIDGVPSAPVPLNAAGMATLTTSALAEGTHLVVGTYSGSTGLLTSNGSVTQRVDNQTIVTGSTYCNAGALTIPAVGAATPYPSNITVTGLAGSVATVTATLNGVSHAVPVDLDVMLSGPTGQNVMLMSDAGGTAPVSGANVVFDDGAAGAVPAPLTSGTFTPTDDDSDAADAAFPAPAPAVSAATALSTFTGTNGNGVWSLWVVDDATGDAGSIGGGWCLTFTTIAATTTTLTSSLNPSTAGQSVTFTATVTSGGSPVTSGSVAFSDGGSPLGAPVSLAGDGTATLTTSALSVGSHTISAAYTGPAEFATSSGSATQIVNAAPTDTALSSSFNPSDVGAPVTFTATVTSGGSPVTSGTVTFTDDSAPLATVSVDATGTATFTTSALVAGTHPITATYSGTAALAGSSDTLDQSVAVIPTSTSLTSSANPSVEGQPVTFTATVTAGGSPVAASAVVFADGGTALGAAVPLAADGTATLTTSALGAGTHDITASFAGDAVYAGSDDDLEQVVDPVVVADAGGPYTVAEGGDLHLDGSGSSPGATYAWDVDGDGDFSDATGVSPTLTWLELEALGIDDGPAAFDVTLRVVSGQQEVTDATTLDATNTGPETVVTGSLTATAGEPFTIKVGADDPSSADMADLFIYTVDWGDGSEVLSVDGPADPPVTHTYVAAGTYSASLTATDKDGATGAALSIRVVVVAAPSPTPPPPDDDDDELPPTGTDSTVPLIAAAVLLTLGAALVLRRRRHS